MFPGDGEQVVDSLIYIRTSDMGQIMWETGKDDIAEPLRKLFEDCLYEKEKDLEDKQTANTHIIVNVATELDFKKKSVTRMPTELIEIDNSAQKFRVPRDASFEDFRHMVHHPLYLNTYSLMLSRYHMSMVFHLLRRGIGCGEPLKGIRVVWKDSSRPWRKIIRR